MDLTWETLVKFVIAGVVLVVLVFIIVNVFGDTKPAIDTTAACGVQSPYPNSYCVIYEGECESNLVLKGNGCSSEKPYCCVVK